MSDDEPDYLSDEFLVQCIPNDVRPGLLYHAGQKRKHELLKQQEKDNVENRKKNKSQKQIEEERREQGLNTAIGADNKGFQMLQRMGFKPGTSIGLRSRESTSTSSSIKEPVPIVIKSDRKGLGEKTKKEETRAKIEEWKQRREQLADPNQYRNRIREDVIIKEINIDLKRAQSACKTLNAQNNVVEPPEIWFWPPVIKVKEDDEDEEDLEEEQNDSDEAKVEPPEQLQAVTRYLRSEYFYCIWCGTNYDNEEDLENSCPGNSRQEH
ncbi:unnamed protein product [Allacma fusca]|uniref:G patch domain-containing protein 11 n=1 Tax=Allacma fusca TaxID=39272 RepID=A0A8J2JZT3_9HEXA|nr:unnamed protein product [Allacma fusca]